MGNQEEEEMTETLKDILPAEQYGFYLRKADGLFYGKPIRTMSQEETRVVLGWALQEVEMGLYQTAEKFRELLK